MARMMIEQSVITSDRAQEPGRHPVNQKDDMAALIGMFERVVNDGAVAKPRIPVLMTSESGVVITGNGDHDYSE